jgi:hypothetical protein
MLMSAKIKSQTDDTLVIEITLPLERSMLEGEGYIEQALNEAGTLATGELLKCFDTDGSAIQMGSTRSLSRKMSHFLSRFLFEIHLLFHRFARI